MNAIQDTFHRMVQAEWNDDTTAAAWSKWAAKQVAQTQAISDAMLARTDIRPGMQVLDLACGTGDPAVRIAGLVGPKGRVTACDLSKQMLAACEDNAALADRANMRFAQADVHTLPFDDEVFDRVTSRFGIMYFVDVARALREVRRVLRTHSIASFVAWGPLEMNPFFSCALGPFFSRLRPSPPPPDAPTPFRFAAEGQIATVLGKAGFSNVREERVVVPMPWPGTPQELWQHIYEVGAPLRPIFDGLGAAERDRAISEVLAGFNQYFDGKSVTTPGCVMIATGEK
jgi:ubiquinone/menaquinone biosynthesis C-methylase UbiE